MSNSIEINGCKLSPKAIDYIRSAQDEDNQGLKDMKNELTDMLVEMIQLKFGEEKSKSYISVLADTIELVHLLHT